MLSINEQYSEIFKGISEGKVIQKFDYQSNTWSDVSLVSVLKYIADYTWGSSELRVKHRTIRIGSYDVPEPMRDAPHYGAKYYFVTLSVQCPVSSCTWNDDEIDRDNLSSAICHSTKEAAEIHAKAILSLTAVDSFKLENK